MPRRAPLPRRLLVGSILLGAFVLFDIGLFGWLIFGETLSPYTIAGAVLIVAGCILAARKPEEASPALEVAA